MNTVDSISPTLRIQIGASKSGISVLAQDSETGTKMVIAQDVTSETLDAANRIIWSGLNEIVSRLRSDPCFTQDYGDAIAFRTYGVGKAALLRLAGDDGASRIEDVQHFCAQSINRAREQPPIIEVVAPDSRHRIPIEILPLLGDLSDPRQGARSLSELASALPGIAAICVHDNKQISEPSGRDIPVQMFLHRELPGAKAELHNLKTLESSSRVRLVGVYPSKGSRPTVHAELELTSAICRRDSSRANARATRPPMAVAHFACHIADLDKMPVLKLFGPGWRAKEVTHSLNQLEAMISDYGDLLPPKLPLVCLYACQSGVEDLATYTSAVGVFEKLQPDAIIGSLARLPDLLAREFSWLFYAGLTAGDSIGEAVRNARSRLLEEPYFNPLGLLVASYGGELCRYTNRAGGVSRFVPAGA